MMPQRTTALDGQDAPSASLSLRAKLLFFTTALVLLPGALLAVIAERSSSASLQSVIGRQLAREAGQTADRLSAVLRRERETLDSFARQDLMREIRVSDIDKRVSMALATLRDGAGARVDYLVVDPERTVVAASAPGLIGTVPEWTDLLGTSAGAAADLIGPIRDGPPGSSHASLLVTAPIGDPDDRTRSLGTLIGVFDWGALTRVTEAVRRDLAEQGVEADVLVSRSDGEVIGGARASREAGRAVGRSELAAVAGGLGRGAPDYTLDARGDFIIGRAALGPDLPDWKLLVVESRAAALAPARRSSRRLAVAMGLVLVTALGLATLAARRVVQPLSELTGAIRGLSHGGARRVSVRSEDEVGTLAIAFNDMASELERAQRELVEAEKFAFLGELAAGVAHEVRTALNVLGSAAQILERSLPSDTGPEAAEMAEMIRAEVGRLAEVVSDLLTLARGRPPALEPGLLSEPLTRAADFVAPQAREKGIRLIRTIPSAEPCVSCDAELIYQVAVNLLANAIQALGYGNCIELRVLEASAGQGGFEVRDDGPGVPDELRERVFEPFVTGRDGGVGLGLTFVKRVVHDHRGSVSLEPRPGTGTCIRVRLPVEEAQA